MRIPRLKIEHQMARISVDSQMASLSIERPKVVMRQEKPRAEMTVKTTTGKVRLDMEGFFNNIGLKSTKTLSDEISVRASANVDEFIEEINSSAEFVGTLTSKENTIGQLTRNKMMQIEMLQANGCAPDAAVKMEGVPGGTEISWSIQGVKINWEKTQALKITVDPEASVKVSLAQKPYVKISLDEQSVLPETGRIIDGKA